jgi:hypothetical protein
MCQRRSRKGAVLGLVGLALFIGGATASARASDKTESKKNSYELEFAFVSFAASIGAHIPVGAPRRKVAFAFDLDAGARPIFKQTGGAKSNLFGTLALFPVVGYSYVPLEGAPMHLFTAGLGFGYGREALFEGRYYLIARVVTGDVGGVHLTGGRVELQVSAWHVLGLSAGYQALTGSETHHAIRLMLTLDVGSLVSLIVFLG